MVVPKHTKWAIGAAISWSIFFTILFAGVIPRTALVQEYGCTVKNFHVDPRFDCATKCPLLPDEVSALTVDNAVELDSIIREMEKVTGAEDYDEEAMFFYEEWEMDEDDKKRRRPTYPRDPEEEPKPDPHHPHCDDLERDTLAWYSPRLCLNARWGFEDPLCPPESATCYTGRNWVRKCNLKCPLAYNITVGLEVDKIGHVDINRDLGTDDKRYKSYKNEYAVGKRMSCQVMKDGNDKVRWVDERISHTAFAWWKWSMFAGSMLLAIVCTSAAGVYYARFRHGYMSVQNAGGDADEANAAAVAAENDPLIPSGQNRR